jgi:hypothetical protein
MRLIALAAALCVPSAAAAEPSATAARKVLATRCSSCHDSKTSRSSPGALRVFDTADEAWAVHLTSRQLPELAHRLGSKGTPAEKAALAGFIADEQRRRAR